MRKRRKEFTEVDDDPPTHRAAMWRVADFAKVRARRQMLALEAARLDAELTRERQIRAGARAGNARAAYGPGGRAMIVRWMFAEGRAIQIESATVGLAVCYLDRIVHRETVRIGDMQVLASACLHLARKLLEVGGDGMDVVETDDSVMNADVEMYAIEKLEWRLALPTAHSFVLKLMDKFWISESARPTAISYLECLISWEESLQFYPSTIACVAILALSRDRLLHPASKEMLFKFISSQGKMVEETSSALRTFHDRLGTVSMNSVDSSSTDSTSSLSSSGSEDEFVMNLLTLDYMERCISVPSS